MYKPNNTQEVILLKYLNQYLSKKNLRMRYVIKSIKDRIENNQPITIKQFNSVIKFIEREPEFKSSNRNQILEFFEPLIERKVIQYGNDLSEHLV